MIEITCKRCGKRDKSTKGKLQKLTCKSCKFSLIEFDTSKATMSCDNCSCINFSPSAFGWKSVKCRSCGQPVPHPALKNKGGRSDRGVLYPEMLTIKCSKDTKSEIEKLCRTMNTTQGAVTRYLLKISLDRLQ